MSYKHLASLTPDGVIYINDNLGTMVALKPPMLLACWSFRTEIFF